MQQHLLQQRVDAHAGFGRHRHKGRIAAEFFGHHLLGHQPGLDALQVGLGLVGLGQGHHDRHIGRFGVLDGLFGLRHHAVVGGADQDHHVGGLGTAGTHGREGLVAGGVEEGHHAARGFYVVGPDVLRDATRFARRHLGAPNVVEQRGLAVVHVTHDRDHGRTRPAFGLLLRGFFFGEGLWVVERCGHRLVPQFFDHNHGRVLVQRLVDGDHLAQLHQLLDDLGRLERHLVRQFGHGDGLGHVHLDHLGLGLGRIKAV